MKTTRLYQSLLLAATFTTLLLATPARASEDTSSSQIAFSDPNQPGTLKVVVKMGDITISGADTHEVTVHTDLQPTNAPRRKDGLRVISANATYSLTEKNNVVTLDTGNEFWSGSNGTAEFKIEVPRNTHVVVTNGYGGEVNINDLSGDIEVKSLNGEITLRDISGGALVETMNGEISARITQLHADKPLSFTSMNGEIDLHIPTDAQATVRLRTQNGAILTDFDEKALVIKTENLIGNNQARYSTVRSVNDTDIKIAVREAVRAGMEAAREAAEAMREAAQAAREAAEEARAPHGSTPPVPPAPPVPTMTGGRQVSGALNGGDGPEIYVNAMNGDITLRKME